MRLDLLFFGNSILLGVGLAMDAFSVSVANGLSEPKMKKRKMLTIAGIFAAFQAIMPALGWICVHTVLQYFSVLETFVPYIALILLLYIGGKMIYDGIKNKEQSEDGKTNFLSLIVQGIATSIDALSVGFTIASYELSAALLAALIIAAVTFVICFAGVILGKKFGDVFSNKASIVGGAILIFIGLEIFIKSFF